MNFKQTLTTTDGATMVCAGSILPNGEVVWGEGTWNRDADGPTQDVIFELFRGDLLGDPAHTLRLNGHAWRGLEDGPVDENAVDKLLHLVALNPEKAQALATYLSETPEAQWAFTRALVTIDVTQSCTVLMAQDGQARPSDKAIFDAARDDGRWEVNEGNEVEPYFGDPENDIEEVDLSDYLRALIADEQARRDPQAERIALLEAALKNAEGAIDALSDQIDQMKGSFDDDDHAIRNALEAGDTSLLEIRDVLKNAPSPGPAV